jgi:Domain of unknown function (DUF4145)
MPVDRQLWCSYWFTKQKTPPWPCPTCHHGNLKLVANSLFEYESIECRRSRSEAEWDMPAYDGVFCCVLRCTNDTCMEHVAVSGLSEGSQEAEHGNYVVCLVPRMFTPALHIVSIPEECPPTVANEFQEAFRLYWSDLAGGLNHIRKAVELIMDHLKIKKLQKDKKGKFERLTLHKRIALFRSKNPALADRLEAVKWLGNAGSHPAVVSHDTFFNACDLLEDFIHSHFEKRGNRIVALTKKVIKRKGRD